MQDLTLHLYSGREGSGANFIVFAEVPQYTSALSPHKRTAVMGDQSTQSVAGQERW